MTINWFCNLFSYNLLCHSGQHGSSGGKTFERNQYISVRPNNVSSTCFGKLFGRIFGRNCFGFLSFFRHFGRNNLFRQKDNCFGRKNTVLAERLLFWEKKLFWQRHFILAETACFGRIHLFRPVSAEYSVSACRNAEMPKKWKACFGRTLIDCHGANLVRGTMHSYLRVSAVGVPAGGRSRCRRRWQPWPWGASSTFEIKDIIGLKSEVIFGDSDLGQANRSSQSHWVQIRVCIQESEFRFDFWNHDLVAKRADTFIVVGWGRTL